MYNLKQQISEEQPSEELDSFFRAGISPQDVPGLHRLLKSQPALEAISGLFSGSFNFILIRIMILQEIGRRTDAPHWSPRELDKTFTLLDETKFNSALNSLKRHKLLNWLPEISCYEVSPLGRMALAALSSLFAFGQEEGSEIGYITSQIAASHAIGEINPEALEHLLSRLTELDSEFNRALVSGSEQRIRAAESKLQSVWSWVAKGSEIIENISADLDSDAKIHRLAQKIGRHQSKMLNMASRFQAELNLIEKNRVMLDRGVSSSDILSWLARQPVADLAHLGNQGLTSTPKLDFVLGDILIDIAEDVLDCAPSQPEEESIPPLPPSTTPDVGELERISYRHLDDFKGELGRLTQPRELTDIVPDTDFATSSYRLSLLSLLGRSAEIDQSNPVKSFVELPLDLEIAGAAVQVDRYGVKTMSSGSVTPREPQHD